MEAKVDRILETQETMTTRIIVRIPALCLRRQCGYSARTVKYMVVIRTLTGLIFTCIAEVIGNWPAMKICQSPSSCMGTQHTWPKKKTR